VPSILSFTPTHGPVGTVVTINLNGFQGTPTEAKFNGSAALTWSEFSSTQIAVTVPTGVTTGPISVRDANNGGPTVLSDGDFTVDP